jgi:hypothetical protein
MNFGINLGCSQDPGIILEERGQTEVKGKGAMRTFWVVATGDSARRSSNSECL